MKTLMTLWVWTSPGLAWEPLRGLRLAVRLLVHSALAWTVAKVTFYFLLFVSAFFLFLVLLILFAILGASDSTISGWANVLEAVYNDIGGCSSYIFYFLTFCLTFLTLNLLLGCLRHHLKNVEYFKLLRMNLEQQCVVCFFFCFLDYYSTLLMADAHFGRVTIFRRPSKSVAHKRWLTAI